MERLNPENINKPDLAYKFFTERWRSQMHYCDWARFKQLAKDFKGGKYLDAGCFNSPFPFELTRDWKNGGAEINAIDYCEPLIKDLQVRYPEVKYQVMDVNKMTFADGEFDYVVAGELIEHMESPKDTIKELLRVLKVGGTLAISTPLNEIQRGSVSDEHLWSFGSADLIEIMSPYGEVVINYLQDNIPILVAYCKKTKDIK